MSIVKELKEWRLTADRQLALLNVMEAVCSQMTYETKRYNVEMNENSIRESFHDFRDGVTDERLDSITLNDRTAFIDFDDRRYTVSLLVNINPLEDVPLHPDIKGRNIRGEFTNTKSTESSKNKTQ